MDSVERDQRRKLKRRSQRGYSLVVFTVSLVTMLGMLGLAVDLGRAYILRNELQSFVDAAALAASSEMDGSQTGIQRANSMALAGPMGSTKPNAYNFGTEPVSNATATYARSFTGTYDSYATARSGATNNYTFIRVTASATLPLFFMPAVKDAPLSLTLSATATAGQRGSSTVSNGGLVPFAPDAHNQSDTTHFGWTPGGQYTLKWGNGSSTTCTGDAGFTPPGNPPSEHGFVDIGQGNGNSAVRSAITSGGYPNANSTPSSLSTADSLRGVPGNRGASIFDALSDRSSQDTDTTSTTYQQYVTAGTGNGRRIVTVPVGGTWSGNGSNARTTVLGFANFFLDRSYSGSSGPICATYIGPATLNGNSSGATDSTKIYSNVLFQ